MYIAAGNYVSVLDRDGARISEIALGAAARCVAVAGDGTVYAGLRDHVEVFDAQGQAPRDLGFARQADVVHRPGGGGERCLRGGCRQPRGAALRQVRQAGGPHRREEQGAEHSRPHRAQPVPRCEAGARWSAAREQHRGGIAWRPTRPNGDLEFFWGKPSAAIEGFCGCCNPIGLALLPDGRYVTCEKGLPRVKVYSAEGVFESVVAGAESFPENAKATFVKGAEDCTAGRAGRGGGFAAAHLHSRPGDRRRARDEDSEGSNLSRSNQAEIRSCRHETPILEPGRQPAPVPAQTARGRRALTGLGGLAGRGGRAQHGQGHGLAD